MIILINLPKFDQTISFMKSRFLLFSAFVAITFIPTAKAQVSISIPAHTAYAVPINDNIESKMFSTENGIQNWTNPKTQIKFYFKIRKTGDLTLSLFLKNTSAGNTLKANFAGKDFNITVPQSSKFIPITIGKINITDTGFYELTLSSVIQKGKTITAIKSLLLSGEASEQIHFNSKPRKNAASVHLFYPLPDTTKALSFYNEISIPRGSDVVHSYFMACGFSRGYFGIQVNSPTERRVIFSVWDAGDEAVNRSKVSEENKVELIAKGTDVFADGFGNEGTGGHSHWVYPWKTEETYKFLVTALTDSATNSTTYTGYFFMPETQKWKLIAAFKAPKDGGTIRKLYSFVENFDGSNGQLTRKANFKNQWIRTDKGAWQELTNATFSFDATGKAGDRIDFAAGIENNSFYLQNGGFKEANIKYHDNINRYPNTEKPIVDLYKNTDSLTSLQYEISVIENKIKEGNLKIDGSSNNVFYSTIKEGETDFVTITDTVVVFYKGQLLDGFVFDETKETPAVFPLNRLIKGWQIGLPFCKVGGKIRLIMPSAMAYSIRNLGKIPPNSTLIFDIEVLEVRKKL